MCYGISTGAERWLAYEMVDKNINQNKKCELSHRVPNTVHSETVFFSINNIIFGIITHLFNQNK